MVLEKFFKFQPLNNMVPHSIYFGRNLMNIYSTHFSHEKDPSTSTLQTFKDSQEEVKSFLYRKRNKIDKDIPLVPISEQKEEDEREDHFIFPKNERDVIQLNGDSTSEPFPMKIVDIKKFKDMNKHLSVTFDGCMMPLRYKGQQRPMIYRCPHRFPRRFQFLSTYFSMDAYKLTHLTI